MARPFLASSAAELVRRCSGCDGREDGAVEAMLQCQKVSDLLIAASFFSIPLELFFFATCADLAPLMWVVLQFCAFIVLCGATHLLAVFTHAHPNSYRLLLAHTVAKVLAAVASSATAVSLLSVIPKMLRLKVRESMLHSKASRLHRDLGLIRRREEATSHVVRALASRIRGSALDARAILRTTVLQLADALGLHNCAVWMRAGDDHDADFVLVFQLNPMGGNTSAVAADDPDVLDIKATNVAKVLRPDSRLATASGGVGGQPAGAAAAIRIPMLKVSNFDGGAMMPEMREASDAILVLVLPNDACEGWSSHDLEVVQVVADHAAVALSHATVLEESRSMRDRFAEQHRAILEAKHDAAMATRTCSSIQSAMCDGMRRPVHSIIGLLSLLQQQADGSMRPEQRLAVDAIARTSSLVSALMNDVMDAVTVNREHMSLQREPFSLHCLIREAICVAGCLSACGGACFSYHKPESSLPDLVIGDDKRVLHLLLHMVGILLSRCTTKCGACRVSFSIRSINVGDERYNPDWIPMRPNISGCNFCIKFQVGIERSRSCIVAGSSSNIQFGPQHATSISPEVGLSFSMYCNKIVQMLNGNMRSASDSDGLGERITLILQFKLPQSLAHVPVASPQPSIPHFNGLRVLLADQDSLSREVTGTLLKKLGCQVMSVPSGENCLTLLASTDSPFELVVLDLDMRILAMAAEMDGFEVAMRIRELRNCSWLLIVVTVTPGCGIDDGAVREMCQRAGINGLIVRPITLPVLGTQLCRVLQDN